MTGLEYIGRRDLHPFWDGSCDPNREDVADAYEQGKIDGYNEGFDAGAEQADTHQNWISVEEELPKETNMYIVVHCGVVCTMWWYDNIEEWAEIYVDENEFLQSRRMDGVTHWMPLPPPVVSKTGNARIIGTAEHIKVALDVLDKKGDEK